MAIAASSFVGDEVLPAGPTVMCEDVSTDTCRPAGSVPTASVPADPHASISTVTRAEFRVSRKATSGPIDSTDTKSGFIAEKALIDAPVRQWKNPGGHKPPYPPRHCLDAKGTRQRAVGWQIMRREKCPSCKSKYVRLVAGYISATAMAGLKKESYDTKIGIIRNILRGRASEVDQRLGNLRCATCAVGDTRASD